MITTAVTDIASFPRFRMDKPGKSGTKPCVCGDKWAFGGAAGSAARDMGGAAGWAARRVRAARGYGWRGGFGRLGIRAAANSGGAGLGNPVTGRPSAQGRG